MLNLTAHDTKFAELVDPITKQRLLRQLTQSKRLQQHAAAAPHLLDPDMKSHLLARWRTLEQERYDGCFIPKSAAAGTCDSNPCIGDSCVSGSHFSEAYVKDTLVSTYEQNLTDWFIDLFNWVFSHYEVTLERGDNEPEYFPATATSSAKVLFAHGFFSSALHEVSHWCIAGKKRRQLPDYGYWYAPDGRSLQQQKMFEKVEIKPQALECLLSLICSHRFRVSQDNLFASFDTSFSTFERDVYDQVQSYLIDPDTIPIDAQLLVMTMLRIIK